MRNVFIIAKWELRTSKVKFDRKSLILLFLLCLTLCFAMKTINFRDKSMVREIYNVQVINDPIIKEALTLDGRFTVYEGEEPLFSMLREGKLDLIIVSNEYFMTIYHDDSKKTEGALDALEQAVKRYRIEMLWYVNEDEVTKAFPVWTQVHYLKRAEKFQHYVIKEESKPKSKVTSEEIKKLSTNVEPKTLREEEAREIIRHFKDADADEINVAPKDYVLPPSLLSPPLPFYSAIVTFIFALPLYLFSQFYSQSVIDEKINKKVELLLSSPINSKEMVFGKMLVYFLLTLVTEVVISIVVLKKFDYVVVATLIPVILIFLAFSFFSSLISRSFKENSFIIVFFSVILLAYFYFPAMFYNIHAISKISPITLIVRVIEEETIEFREYLFTTLPLYLSSFLTFYFGMLTFKEEYLFDQSGIGEKILNMAKEVLKKGKEKLRLFFFSFFMISIAYLLELVYLVLLFQIPMPYCLYAMLLLSAFTEEALKVFGVIAMSLEKGKAKLSYPIISAVGFFFGERIMKLFTITQITNSIFGLALFKEYFISSLSLHIFCTLIASLPLLFKRKKPFILALLLASILHASYNYTLVIR